MPEPRLHEHQRLPAALVKAGLRAGSGYYDCFAKERFVIEPLQLLAQFDNIADDKIAGGFRFAAATSAAAVPTVVIRVRCSGLVPQRMTAAGVSALRPLAMRFFVILVRFSTPIRKTKVSTAVARPLQLNS